MASNPDATAKLFSAGLKHGVPKNSPYAAVVSPHTRDLPGSYDVNLILDAPRRIIPRSLMQRVDSQLLLWP